MLKIPPYILLILIICPLFASSAESNVSTLLWPAPASFSCNNGSDTDSEQFSISDFTFKIYATPSELVQSILNFYIVDVLKQNKPSVVIASSQQIQQNQQNLKKVTNGVTINIIVKNATQIYSLTPNHQKYSLTIRQNQVWQISSDCYPGIVRALQTFSQILQKQSNSKYVIKNRPILIDDVPKFHWRGLMIDTSRHYLPLSTIKKLMNGMLFNKMNVLHWHIVDQDSFPAQISQVPELSQYGNLKGTYSQANIAELITFAKIRSIRVIPEFDTPAHTRSWGRSPQYSSIVVEGEYPFQGQFNPTLNLTYDVVKKVMNYTVRVFPDSYSHLGGDEIDDQVWDKEPGIKKWMKQNNMTDYQELQIYYRKYQKSQLNKNKKAIYWANQDIDLPVEKDDVIQWWGETKNMGNLQTRTNQVILSNYDIAYMDVGFGDELADKYRKQISWKQAYTWSDGGLKNVSIIGGQACIWAELTYEHNIQQKLWIRSSAIAERMWNMNKSIESQLLNIVQRLVAQKKRMQSRGFKVSPVSVGLCEKDPTICFS